MPSTEAIGPHQQCGGRHDGFRCDLYRGRGDCRHAIGAYQLAMSASRARDVVEAASFHRAECMVRTGDGGGVDALRGYIRAYPEGHFRRQATELVEQATSKTAGK